MSQGWRWSRPRKHEWHLLMAFRVLHYPLSQGMARQHLLRKQQERNEVRGAGGGKGSPQCPRRWFQLLAAQESAASADRKVLSRLSTSLGSQALSCPAQLDPKPPQGTFHTTASQQQHGLLPGEVERPLPGICPGKCASPGWIGLGAAWDSGGVLAHGMGGTG